MVSDNACMDVYTNQPLEWPTCQSPATVAVVEVTKDLEGESLKKGLSGFADAVWRDFVLTNQHTAGKAAKFGAGVVVGGAVAARLGARTPLAWARSGFGALPYEFATKLGGGTSTLQWTTLSAGQRLGRVALAAGAKFALVTMAYEGGVLIGAVINQALPEDVKDAIGGTINEIVNEGGYKLLWERPFGIAVK
jgi:hypothetical protein